MTSTHSVPTLNVTDVASAVNALRMQGLRMSSARRLVIEALFAADGLVTAEDIAGGLAGRLPGSDLASVYRNLETLEEVGLVRHVHLGHGPGLYAHAGAGERHFAVCERCSSTVALDASALVEVRLAVRAMCGYEPRFSHFPLVGLCPDCAAGATTGSDHHTQNEEQHAHP